MSVAFNQTEERNCNKKVKAPNPGPGTYIDINNPNNSSICKSLNKIKEDRTLAESQGVKLGVFGSTTAKFDKSWMTPKEGPDPGAYDIASVITKPTMDLSIKGKSTGTQSQTNVETTLAIEKKMPDSIFKSTTDRFAVSYSAKNPGIRILQSKGGRRAKIVT